MDTVGKKVLVALSGGVDSSVAAALLRDAGYAVEGAFIVTWQAPWLPCTWREERRDAMRVAAHLHIPFHTVDLGDEYERDVVTYLVDEYRAGRTPNPDVMCNARIKFGAFFSWALAHGFDRVATGHYARVEPVGEGSERGYHLCAGVDAAKDQSYFLWTLTQAHLARTLFPVGVYEKAEVRARARQYGLPTAEKRDSQGVCFLGKLDMREFLEHYVPAHPGELLDGKGKVIGTHEGAMYYTLGQRHGFTLRLKGPHTPRLYVVAKDIERNTVTVGERAEASEGARRTVHLVRCSWVSGVAPHGTLPCGVRFRYRQSLCTASCVATMDGRAEITFAEPQVYVSAGQSLVLYQGDTCVGGGVLQG